jgi:thiol-disulfide isomerase/thioredoxin
MRPFKVLSKSFLLVCLVWPSALFGQSGSLVSQMSDLAWAGQVDRAIATLEVGRVGTEPPTAEWLAAVSWVARGASFAERWDVAERYALEAYRGSVALMEDRPLDAEGFLPTALGAAIEVLGHTFAARGESAQAVAFLSSAREEFAGTTIESRIQKNFLLLSLEGKPIPALEVAGYLGAPPPTEDALEGKVVLFFFWAHWCPDCKQQEPVLEALHEEYHDQGLVVVGPTQLYGYISRGDGATPAEELAYLRGEYSERFPIPPWMSVPMGANNFNNFGVSTTPTLVVVDRDGIVQRYNPGTLSHEELVALIEPLLG